MARPAFLVFVSVRALAAAAALLALTLAFVSCSDSEEEIAPASRTPATASPLPSVSPLVTATTTPLPVPTGWQTYLDPVLQFSFAYPPGFNSIDLTAQSPVCCPVRRFTELRPSGAKNEGVTVGVYEEVGALSVKEWAQTYSMCNLDVRPATDVTVSGRPGTVCVGEPIQGQFDYWVIVKDSTRIIYVSAALNQADFQSIVDTLRFPD